MATAPHSAKRVRLSRDRTATYYLSAMAVLVVAIVYVMVTKPSF